jgi:hypothetical protein
MEGKEESQFLVGKIQPLIRINNYYYKTNMDVAMKNLQTRIPQFIESPIRLNK